MTQIINECLWCSKGFTSLESEERNTPDEYCWTYCSLECKEAHEQQMKDSSVLKEPFEQLSNSNGNNANTNETTTIHTVAGFNLKIKK